MARGSAPDSGRRGETGGSDDRGEASRRGRILQVAARLVVHYGPSKTTITDIAREAGVSVGAVYLEFPSKDDIVFALAESRYERVLARMREALDARGSLEARIRRAFDARLAAFLEHCDEGTHGPDLVACSSSPVKTAESRYLEAERALLEDALREGAQAAGLAIASPGQTAAGLLRCYATFRPPALRSDDRAALEAAIDEVHRIVAHGFLGKPSGRR
jgi:AcrR family transcriptional regulator